MKRILHILMLLLLPTGFISVSAYNVLKWETPVKKDDYGVIKHPDNKKLPPNCAILRVKILPRIPPHFNLEDKTGGGGRDLKEFRYVNSQENHIEFFYQINPDDPIQALRFQADGYTTHVEQKVYLEPRSRYETTIFLEQEDWVVVKLKTEPGGCKILNSGIEIGTSDDNGFFEGQLKLTEGFWFSFEKDGYDKLMDPINVQYMKEKRTGEFDTVNMVISIKKTFVLQKTGAAKRGEVIIHTVPGATLYLRETKDSVFGGGTILQNGVFKASLTEGTYTIKAEKKGYYADSRTFNVVNGTDYEETINLNEIKGSVIVKSRPSGADVLIDGKKWGNTPFNESVPIGNHSLSLQKRNYTPLNPISISVDSVTPVRKTLDLSRTNNEWWNSSQFFPHHYIEAYYGMGITSDMLVNNYIGVNYTYIRHTVGFNLSGMYGFNNQDIVATAGPALTLTTQSKTDLDLQLLLGAGYASVLSSSSTRTSTWVAEAGLRFGFDNAITDYPVSLWSVYLGAKYYDRKIVPTLGISLMPVGIFALDYFKEESDFSHVFLDPMVGYAVKSKDVLVGGHFAWQTYNVGFYTSFMYGIKEGNIAAVAGPALHITPNADIFDLSLYGGIGYGRTEYRTHHLAGDFGLRFGFGDNVFSWYNFSLGCTSYGGEWVPNFGLSLLPIKGLIELAKIEESFFPAHYTEFMAAYCFGNREWMLGTNYSWIPSHLGLYGSFLIGFEGSATVNAGPVFRLTPDDYVVDLQLYQGVGWTKFYNHSVGGETGIRMGFKFKDLKFGLFSLNIGANYNKEDAAISFGVSWVLAGTIATAGTAAFFY